jgi:hypothetical protein
MAIQSVLERQFITQYLRDQGFEKSDLEALPKELSRKLMAQASGYASSKLAEIEARSKFIQKIA